MSEARSGQGALKSGGTQARGHTTDHTRLLRTDRWRARAQPGPVGLLEGIDRTFLTTKRFVAIMLALTLLLAALLIGVLQPRASTYTYLTRDLRRAHEGMLDQETGTRAWYATRDDSFLEAVDEGVARLDAANAGLVSHLGVDESVDRLILDLRLAQEAWLSGWAAPTLRSDSPAADLQELDAVLAQGKVLFDDYRVAQGRVLADAGERRDAAVVQERDAMILWAVAEGLVCAAMLAVSRRDRRRLCSSVITRGPAAHDRPHPRRRPHGQADGRRQPGARPDQRGPGGHERGAGRGAGPHRSPGAGGGGPRPPAPGDPRPGP